MSAQPRLKNSLSQAKTSSLTLLLCLLIFWWNGVSNLDRSPIVHQDESWIAAPGYNYWHTGIYGTSLFEGFYGMEDHYLEFMPMFSLILGAWLHLVGLGLFQARLVSLALMLVSLCLTYRLACLLFKSYWLGTMSVIILSFWKIALPLPYYKSGVLWSDVARIARYDALVPLWILIALCLLVESHQVLKTKFPKHLEIGIFVGFASLSHVIGTFIMPAIIVLNGRNWRKTALICLGYIMTLLPWGLFILSHWEDFIGQAGTSGKRFDLLNPQFYYHNLLRENERYRAIFDALKTSFTTNISVIFLFVGLGILVYQSRHNHQSRIIPITLAVIYALFALLLEPKPYSYLTLIMPFIAITISVGIRFVWQFHLMRPLILLLLVVTIIEGSLSLIQTQRKAAHIKPYADFVAEIKQELPPNSRVIAMTEYWLGLADHTADYRSFLVPIWLNNPDMVAEPISIAKAIESIQPDYILVDKVMLYFLRDARRFNHPYHDMGAEISKVLRKWRVIAQYADKSYGRVLIYKS